jgi:hypothetical protein
MKTILALSVMAAYLLLCAAAGLFIYGAFNGEAALNDAEDRT